MRFSKVLRKEVRLQTEDMMWVKAQKQESAYSSQEKVGSQQKIHSEKWKMSLDDSVESAYGDTHTPGKM